MSNTKNIENIWFVTREYGSLAGAGGVKDVAKQLAEALAIDGKQIRAVLPAYGFMDPKKLGFTQKALTFQVDMSYTQEERREWVTIWHKKDKVDIYLIDSPRFAEKSGVYSYTVDEEKRNPAHRQGDGHYDYFAMNVLLQKAALALIIELDQKPDIIHCHDGHTALIPAMIREIEGFRHYFKNTGTVVTIHNAGLGYHQEVADLPFAQTISGLPASVIKANQLNLNFDPLLAASPYAVMNTVSENYARELRETSTDDLTGLLGHTFLKRDVTLEGVTNGIDPEDFDLKNYKKLGLACSFTPGMAPSQKLDGKAKCRKALCDELSTAKYPGIKQTGEISFQPDQPLFTFIGRFSIQKGVDKMTEALKNLLPIDTDFQILILGSGQKEIEDSLVSLARNKQNKGRVCVLRGFDSTLANKVYAAGDFFLIPSLYEPCGLTDFIAQLFGNLPIVHHTGGLVKVIDGETGFSFHEHSGVALEKTMVRAIDSYRFSRQEIVAMQKKAVQLIQNKYTWEKVKDSYLSLYTKALASLQNF
nr:glycogen/starch synthase [Desulfobulbaceae bacterium]